MVYEKFDCWEWIVMESNFIHGSSNVFINPLSISMWMLIVDGMPMFRTEFPRIISDAEIHTLNDGAEELYEELKRNAEDNYDEI